MGVTNQSGNIIMGNRETREIILMLHSGPFCLLSCIKCLLKCLQFGNALDKVAICTSEVNAIRRQVQFNPNYTEGHLILVEIYMGAPPPPLVGFETLNSCAKFCF